jgi:hypothetical protein
MDDRVRQYRTTLETALRRLRPHIVGGRIVGSDMSQFLVVDRESRGAEIYLNAQGGVIVDPAIGGELQGEVTYPSFDLALDAAARCLDGCPLEELQPAG